MLASNLLVSSLVAYAAAKNINIAVSNATAANIMIPASVTADKGDTVTFHFFPRNHDVIQGSLEKPCQPLAGGFNSGFIPSAAGEANSSFIINIADTNPIWYYCSQATHCNLGMAGVINPPSGKNISDYIKAAANATVAGASATAGTGGKITSASLLPTTSGSSASTSAAGSSSTAATRTNGTTTSTASSTAKATTSSGAGPRYQLPAALALAAGVVAVW